jgi:dihydropyrimidinase
MRKLIRGGTVVSATHSSVADVLVDGEEIAAVGSFGDVDAEVVDADGCYVLPGLIDNHTHMAMPFGGTHSIDDYDTGTRAAAAGGTTCIVDFVIQQHPGGLRSSLEEWSDRAAGAAHVDYGFHIAITQPFSQWTMVSAPRSRVVSSTRKKRSSVTISTPL